MDPILWLLQTIGSVLPAAGMARFFTLFLVTVIVIGIYRCARPNWDVCLRKQQERAWDDACRFLIGRIDRLMPVYQHAIRRHADGMVAQLVRNDRLPRLGRDVPAITKQFAEADFCLQDVSDDDKVLLLMEQLNEYVKTTEVK